MKKLVLLPIILFFVVGALFAQTAEEIIKTEEVNRIISTLADDDMLGRGLTNGGAAKASAFIEEEFKRIGLNYFGNLTSYRQEFNLINIKRKEIIVSLNDSTYSNDRVLVVSDREYSIYQKTDSVKTVFEVVQIRGRDNFQAKLGSIEKSEKDVIVLVDEFHATIFKRYKEFFPANKLSQQIRPNRAFVFILTKDTEVKNCYIFAQNELNTIKVNNVVGVLPGKSKPDEFVLFSGHYDHIGFIAPRLNDSIANGADDNASGVTATIALAEYYKTLNTNERSLLFVAFTAEEIGGYGATEFIKIIDPKKIITMLNFEMLGKEAKWGPKSAFITGYKFSNLGKILQFEAGKIGFKLNPDPYTTQNLFFRSDNAAFAREGIPAHTLSTVQIDVDRYYHSVKDDMNTIQLDNLVDVIRAFAKMTEPLVSGRETPNRIDPSKLKPNQ